MKKELFGKIEKLQERLVELVLDEADPDNWSGGDAPLKDLDREQRGDRLWCKKNASATLSLIQKTIGLEFFKDRHWAGSQSPANEEQVEQAISAIEKKSEKLLNEFNARRKNAS